MYRSEIVSAALTSADKRIAFLQPDSTALQAARFLRDNTTITPLLIGSPFALHDLADRIRISLKNIETVSIKSIGAEKSKNSVYVDPLIKEILNSFKNDEIFNNPLLTPLATTASGIADAYFIPYHIDLWKLIRSINPEIGSRMSGFHILHSSEAQKTMLFSDTCINALPAPETLAETAIRSAANFTAITGKTAKVAMLSFSTKGSAKHELPAIVQQALSMVKQKAPSLIIDGEIQFDAAAVAEISEQKAPGNVLRGETNVFIFPNLNSARIGYQIARSIAGYFACGGFIQGLNLPLILSDLTVNYMELAETALIASVYHNR